MRLILHIGTHKTGTTAIQQFLVANRPALARHGFHYASTGTPDANLVANAVALNNPDAAAAFFRDAAEAASRADAHTVVVSAENFYSMAVVAAALSHGRPEDASSQEPILVGRLQSLLPDTFTSTRVVCYFRRPDRFAESLYNQRVKYENFDESFDRYLELVRPMFDYHRNAAAWADVFGAANCTFTSYESVAGDIRTAFLRDILEISDTQLFVEDTSRDNERVSRDVLEFKRELNATMPDDQRGIEYRIACLLEKEMNLLAAEPKDYGEFMSPSERGAFLAALAPELAALASSFGLPPFPAFDEQRTTADWQPYPGLAEESRAELRRAYAGIRRRVKREQAVRRLVSLAPGRRAS